MHLTGLDRLFWALAFIGHCILLGVLIRNRRVTYLPVFTTLISFDILRTIVLFVTLRFGSTEEYFYTYWTLGFVDLALQFSLVYELCTHVFQPLGVWAPDVRRGFLTLTSVSILIAMSLTWLAAPPTRKLRLAIIIRGNFFCSSLLAELLVAMIVLSVTLGLPWRTHVSRVAQGIGAYAFIGIVTDGLHGVFGQAPGGVLYRMLSRTQIGFYLLCLVYWTVTLAMEEPKPRKMPEQLHRELRILQQRAALVLSNLRMTGSPS